MQDIHPTISFPGKQRSRRSFSPQEKKRILDEAASSSVSEAARNNGISTSLLFQWRKGFEKACPIDINDVTPGGEHERALVTIKRLETIETLISEKLVAEIRSERMSAYNAATAFGSMTNAVAKLAQLKFEVLQRCQSEARKPDQDLPSDGPTLSEEREAEQACLELIRARLAEKKRIAEEISMGGEGIAGQQD